MALEDETGRANQKRRTRIAILAACREIIRSGGSVTMPEVARSALVSEATAYRYFPDLASLVSQALAGMWPSPAEALAPVADSDDPVTRVAFACEFLLRGVLGRQEAVRAMISAAIIHPEMTAGRPGIRFGLIDQALARLKDTFGATDPARFAQLKQDLAGVISAEAFFSLVDLGGLAPDDAIASLVRTATTITEAAVRRDPVGGSPSPR
jgi:AcrR family transcriptional regulator